MRDDTLGTSKDHRERDRIHEELKRVLARHDPFWPRWVVLMETLGSGQ